MTTTMNIKIPAATIVGSVRIPQGNFDVEVDEPRSQIHLRHGGLEFSLNAMHRPSKVRVTEPVTRLSPVEREASWLLVVRTPPADEWVVRLNKAGQAEGSAK